MSLPIKSDQIVVVSGGAANPTISAGTTDPTAGLASPEGSLYLRYVASAGQLFVKTGPGNTDWGAAPIGANGGTLDQAYDFGGLGAGRTITADAGSVQVDANTADAQAALTINRTPGSAAGAIGINMTLGANVNTLGNGLQITDGGTGNSIYVQKNAAGVVLAANLTDPGAQALTVTVNGAPTSVSPVSIVANQTGTTASLLSVSKIPSGSTAGAAISVSMGANTTGPGITVSQVGAGAAIQVSSGAIEMANSSPGVSAANQGRIKYDSTSQTFQVSLNGAAYQSLSTSSGAPTISQAASSYVDFYTVGGDVGISFAGASAYVDDPQTYGLTPNTAGIIVMDITGGVNSRCFVFLTDGTDGLVLGHGVFDIAWRCATTMTLAGAADGATDYKIMVGATPANALIPGGDPGLQFVAGIAMTGNTNWWAQVQANTPAVDTGIPVVADGMHTFRIVYDSSIPSAKFYIDGALVATITTNLPLNLTVERITGITNSTAGNHMKWIADYVTHTYTFATPR